MRGLMTKISRKTFRKLMKETMKSFRDKMLAVMAVVLGASVPVNAAPSDVERGAWFREARFGMFIHWGIYSIPGKGEWSYCCDSYRPGEYENYAKRFNPVNYNINQLTTEYGKLDLLFLDYTSKTKANLDYFGRDRILEMVYRNQPDILVNDRLSYFKDNCHDFDYYTPEICVPNQPQVVKGREVMWETCATMNDHWGYCREDENWKTPEAVVAGLIGCVSRNGNLLLNVGPTELGANVLRALAEWNKTSGESVTGCGKSEFRPPHGCVYTQKGNSLYCHFLQTPLGDTILPQLKGKIARATLLRAVMFRG